MTTYTAPGRDVFVRRRLFVIYLPMIVIGMVAYFYSYTITLTANGLTVLVSLWVIGWIGTAAWDAGDRP